MRLEISVEPYEGIIRLIEASDYIVALTGAGISTEAGIPDFRSPGTGLWAGVDPMSVFSSLGFRLRPKSLYEHGQKLLPVILNAKPTKAHLLLAHLERNGKLKCVITQNIDCLHQKAGSREVIEVHGNLRTGFCIGCKQGYTLEEIARKLEVEGQMPPRCGLCGKVIKPNIVLFGDPLPAEGFRRAVEEVGKCDLLLVMGSSLVVHPVADLPRIAIQNGAKLIILNIQPTGYDQYAEVVLHERLEDLCDRISNALDKRR